MYLQRGFKLYKFHKNKNYSLNWLEKLSNAAEVNAFQSLSIERKVLIQMTFYMELVKYKSLSAETRCEDPSSLTIRYLMFLSCFLVNPSVSISRICCLSSSGMLSALGCWALGCWCLSLCERWEEHGSCLPFGLWTSSTGRSILSCEQILSHSSSSEL